MNAKTSVSTLGAEVKTTTRVIEAVGCKFTEYRGEGRPVAGKPSAIPGDVYFDLKEQPYTVWAYQSDSGWRQWRSMAESKDCKHPELERILYPTGLRFLWVPMSSYDNYLRQTKLRLGKRIDAADTHIRIILDHERGVKPAPPPQIEAPSPERAPSPDSNGDDDEVEQLAGSAIIDSDSVKNVPNKTDTEIMMELRADLEDRCRIMRVQNDNIQKALTVSSGTRYMYDSQWLNFHRCDRT